MLKIKTRNLYILYNKIKDLYRLEFLGYNMIAVFFSLLAYISPFIFLYHFQATKQTSLLNEYLFFMVFVLISSQRSLPSNWFHQVVTIIWQIVYISDGFDRCGFDERLGFLVMLYYFIFFSTIALSIRVSSIIA